MTTTFSLFEITFHLNIFLYHITVNRIIFDHVSYKNNFHALSFLQHEVH